MSDDESIESIEIDKIKGSKEYLYSLEEQTHTISEDSNSLEGLMTTLNYLTFRLTQRFYTIRLGEAIFS